MQFVTNAPRQIRSHVGHLVSTQTLPLLIVGPKHTNLGKGSGHRYATIYQGQLIQISKRPVATRDAGRGPEAIHRYGRKASEYRVRAGSYVTFQVVKDGKKVTEKRSASTGRLMAA